jgi:protein phosphatase
MVGRVEFTWESAAESHAGKVRATNEDSILNRRDIHLWAVADGMGGHLAGAEASRLVVEALGSTLPSGDIHDFSRQVKEALELANRSLVNKGLEEGKGISGSTVAIFFSIENKASVVWVGDSRVYRYRRGELSQISRDHNQMEEWIAQGLIDRKDARKHSPSNIITRAIGADERLEPDEKVLDVEPSDTYLICSDGLYNEVSDEELTRLLTTGHCAFAAKQLIELALAREARDNVSVVVVHARCEDDAETRTRINPRVAVDQ